jgi:hypothetical protein
MPTEKHDVIVETPTEARQAETGPSILLMLTVTSCSEGPDQVERGSNFD